MALYWRLLCLLMTAMEPEDGQSKESEFAKAMALQGVKPLKKTSRAFLPVKVKPTSLQRRRVQASGETSTSFFPLGDSVREWLGPHDIVEFRRPGLQHGTFKDFKQGKLRPAATLDLHRCTVAEARQRLTDFVSGCRADAIRCALVMHGKGFHSRPSEEELQSGKAVARIKSFAVHWLQQMPEVLAISSTQAKDGGTGAVYVLFTSREGAGKLPPPR